MDRSGYVLRMIYNRLLAIPVPLLSFLLAIAWGVVGIVFEVLTAVRRVVGALLWCFRPNCSSCGSELAASRFQMVDFLWLLLLLRPKRCTLCMLRQRRLFGR
jgi:hypothetical protein